MKPIIALLLIALWGGPTATAQNPLEGFKEAAKEYNEKEGIKDNPDNNNDAKKAAQEEKWKKQWEETKEEFSLSSKYFNTKELNCMFLMVLYVDNYQKLEQTAKNLKDCDLYGLQATAIALSTTMMYCPEHMNGLSDEEFHDFYSEQFRPILLAENKSDLLQKWVDKFDRTTSGNYKGGRPGEKPPFALSFDVLIGYFSPGFVVRETVNIGRIMEQLRCDER